VHDNNGIQTQTGTADMPNPLADDQKYGIPTTGSLGITTASQIGVVKTLALALRLQANDEPSYWHLQRGRGC